MLIHKPMATQVAMQGEPLATVQMEAQGSSSTGTSDSSSGGGSGSGSGGGYNSGSDGGTDDVSSSGSSYGKSGEDAMYAAARPVHDNRVYGDSSGDLTSDNSDYGSDTGSIGKGENSIGSVEGINNSGDSDKKLTKKSSSDMFWLFALILILGTLLFCMSRRKNKSEGDGQNTQKDRITPSFYL